MNRHEYEIGLHKHELETPALILDLDVMERNLATMTAFFDTADANLRPHVKLHKATPILAHKQIAAGGVGVTCAKLSEAERMAAAGITDILIANEIAGTRKIQRLVNLATYTDVIVAVDNHDNLRDLSAAAQVKGVQLRVLVEVNIGHNRCGVAPLQPALALARAVDAAPGLRFMGLMGYDGHCAVSVDEAEREAKSLEANTLLVQTRECIEGAGLPVEIVSASGTFTYKYAATLPGITEIQAGTYLLMDTTFKEHGVTDFDPALTVLGTVTTRPQWDDTEDLAIIDVGRKSMESSWGQPTIKSPAGATIIKLSQEHGRVSVGSAGASLQPGSPIELWVSDANITIALFDKFYAVRNDVVEAVWDISGSGPAT